MSSPFDFVKSFTTTKENLYQTEALFTKDYVPFVVNRALSNDPRCVLFVDAIATYPDLDKKLQHDFYFYGLPKLKTGSMWTKKQDAELNMDHVKILAHDLNVSIQRAIELLSLIDEEVLVKYDKLQGGKINKRGK
jgi:hypothetical protein